MNKTVNTVLFMIGATLLNLLLIAVLWIVFTIISSLLVDSETGSQEVVTIAYGLSILFAIGGGFFLYNRIIRWVNSKWNLEKYIITSFRNGKRR